MIFPTYGMTKTKSQQRYVLLTSRDRGQIDKQNWVSTDNICLQLPGLYLHIIDIVLLSQNSSPTCSIKLYTDLLNQIRNWPPTKCSIMLVTYNKAAKAKYPETSNLASHAFVDLYYKTLSPQRYKALYCLTLYSLSKMLNSYLAYRQA